ncbi:MAG TPA: PKD domain-containing protein, partial [Prolixibacteraceae bacterium]|nr:PKD domain-containing protein [Prolixibacteraceae bacterium]
NPPIANAGIDQTVNENSINTLDGSISSDLDSDALTYLWTAPEGITLNSNTASKPAFTAPEVTTDTNYTFSLVVNDGWMNSTADQIIVKVKQVNKAPIANAGTDAEITERKTFQLDGRQSSDFDKDAITYKWTAPFDITLSSTTVSNPTFTAPNVDTNTTFTFSLIVNDGHVDSSADQVVITVIPNKAPIANAGTDQQVNENNLFTLDGSASTDPENDLLTYFWTAPEGITLSSNTTAKPTFTTPEVATDTNYTFSLTVYDGKSYSTADDVVISIKNVDKAPYVKNPINSISVDKASPDQIIELQTIFADDDLNDVFSYRVTSNTNDQVVTTAISGSYLTLHFSSQHNGLSEMVITANSNGKEVSSKFNVEVKIPTGIGSFKSDQKLRISPNPTNGKIKVKVDQHSQSGVELIVTDINGNTILKQVIYEKEEWVDLTGNTPGMYLLKTNSDKTNVQKVILK